MIEVLIVEDTLTQAMMLKHLLDQPQFKTTIARTAQKAIEHLALNHPPDLILCDISMPEMDGYQLCKKLKADPKTRDILFVLLSSFNDARDIVSIVNSRADSFMLKRYDEEYFLTGISDLLESRKLRKGASDNTFVFHGSSEEIEGNTVQLTNMLLSSFATIMHLLPLVDED